MYAQSMDTKNDDIGVNVDSAKIEVSPATSSISSPTDRVTKSRKQLFVAIAIIGIIIFGLAGWLIFNILNSPKKAETTQSQQNSTDSVSVDTKDNSSSDEKVATPTEQSTAPDFNFTETTGWTQRSPLDKSFTISFGASETSGVCTDRTDILMIGMVYMDMSGNYTCGDIKQALLPPAPNQLQRTNIAIGKSETLWDKTGAQPVTVTLQQGETAERYAYTNTTDGVAYTIVQYDISYKGKNYVAVWHWRSDTSPSMPQNYFDTMVQKTLTFN